MSHEFEFVAAEQYTLPWGRRYTLWSRSRCRKCGTVCSVVAGIPAYDPPGVEVQGFGQMEPSCRS